ncbi:Lipopolysaccharide assembly protein B [termite gut metagenome]|uniref:Lipopolysaccharide assembly protein B n=1 Tax=termite gut metagenome TaxID=433724 RepID=A0A5J4SE02_9ZZZZ
MKNNHVNKSKTIGRFLLAGGVLFLSSSLLSLEANAQVKLQEETMTIPTYVPEAPNQMPRFYEGKSHQGVQRRIYPYPYDDGLTTNKQDRDYAAIHVENEYIDLAIMPNMGGRIYYANDKTNNYNYLYHNHVVKPSLIGMVGNWISGSLAWGYPHHHGPHTVELMDYKIDENADGSKTVWINTTDRLMRVNILVGYTIYPHSSIIEMTIHPRNRTELSNSFLFWANPAVHADSAYQVIFPPSVQYVTFHGKRDMTAWPIADSWFNNYNFTGMDVSWWKNTHVPSSFFSWDPREDYFGGYDHNLKAGTAWIGNHYISPGMKYWADGNNANGLKTNEGLTDNDGRYIEMMAGFYTDNQPDYSWMQPYETKSGSMIWFPIRELGGLKYANRYGAMNYIINGQTLEVRLNATSPYTNAKVVVSVLGKEIYTKNFNISPAEPQKIVAQLPQDTKEDDLDIRLLDSGSSIILDYRPAEHHPPRYDKPEPLKSFLKPAEIKTVEELYLTGLRLNQFYNATDPMPYYEEALKRDPEDYRTNTQLGILAIKDYNWETAVKYLRTAVKRITSNYTRPKDGEGLYYLGLTLRALGETEEAYDYFYQASWTHAWHTASYYQLAEIDCKRGAYDVALDHLNRSISTNTDNIRALNLKAVVLRKMKDVEGAKKLLQEILKESVINHMALNELYLVDTQLGNTADAKASLTELTRIMRDAIQPYLELGTEYANAGFYQEAIDLLSRLEQKGETFPMLYYYLGYYWEKLGDSTKALSYCQKGSTMSHDYCFPFRSEEVVILRSAMNLNPFDAMAPYYLGNLLYEHQPEMAVAAWEKSRELNNKFYITHRNLALAYKDLQKDYVKALTSMQQSVACSKNDPRLLYEIDVLNELNRVSPKQKYDLLKNNMKTVQKRSETLLRFVTRAVEYGKYDEALKTLETNSIVESEGAREMQNDYLNIYTLKSMDLLKHAKYDDALKYINLALNYPIGLYGRSRYAQFYYITGLIYKKKGDNTKAQELFQKTTEVNTERGTDLEYNYYKGLALNELKKAGEAKQIFEQMLSSLGRENDAFFNQFEGGMTADVQRVTNHYIAGLAYAGLDNKAKARAEFQEALKINPGHIWSQVYLDSLK